jgi:tight adherence protein B
MTGLLFSFLVFSFLLFAWLFFFLLSGKEGTVKRVDFYLAGSDRDYKEKEKETQPKLTLLLKKWNQKLKNRLTPTKSNRKVEHFLQSAGVSWTPGEYMLFRIIGALICGGLFFLLTSKGLLLILGGIVGYLYPKISVMSKRKKRIKRFNDGLADTITSLINSLKAGFSFLQAVKAVEEESDSPIKEEFGLVLKEMQYGSSLEDAFKHLNERVPSQDLEILIQAVLIQRQVGGNLATVLSSIVDTIRERNKIGRQVRTLTAQGKMSGMVIGGLPFALGGIIYVISPSYMGTMFHNVIGLIMLASGLISGIIGFILIQKITTIEV